MGVREEYAMNYKGQIGDPIIAIAMLSEQQYEWAGTPYVLGGQSRGGIDCSGFVQKTFIDRFKYQSSSNYERPKRIMENLFVKKISKQAI